MGKFGISKMMVIMTFIMTFIMMAMNYKMTAMMTNVYNHHEGGRLWHLEDDGRFDHNDHDRR